MTDLDDIFRPCPRCNKTDMSTDESERCLCFDELRRGIVEAARAVLDEGPTGPLLYRLMVAVRAFDDWHEEAFPKASG